MLPQVAALAEAGVAIGHRAPERLLAGVASEVVEKLYFTLYLATAELLPFDLVMAVKNVIAFLG